MFLGGWLPPYPGKVGQIKVMSVEEKTEIKEEMAENL